MGFHDNPMKRTNVSKYGHYVAQISVLKSVCSQDICGAPVNTDPAFPRMNTPGSLWELNNCTKRLLVQKQVEGGQRL